MMKAIKLSALVLILIICGSAAAQDEAKGESAAKAKAAATTTATAPPPMRSTAADRRGVEVTIYNNGTGLVKERRKVGVAGGVGTLLFVDVPSKINPVTVLVMPEDAQDFAVFEQNYEYDLISHQKLMDKYVGRKIKIMRWNEYQDRRETVEAELLSAENGEVYKIDGSIYLGHPGIKILPELPGNLISRPTLSWLYRSKSGKATTLDVSYLTSGMTWSADYVLSIVSDSAQTAVAGLAGWVTVSNQSGASFDDAKLKLVAGNLNRARQGVSGIGYGAGYGSGFGGGGGGGFGSSQVFDYHMYDLQRPTTIKDNQTKQISLMEAHSVKADKEYVTTQSYAFGRSNSDAAKQAVSVYLKIKNTKDNRLGNPLPAGIVRVYTPDAHGRQQFVGEDNVSHTPRDEEINLRVGEAFDVVVERTMTDYRERTSRVAEMDWSISVRNRKNTDVTVSLREMPPRNTWEIRESTHKHKKISANEYRFEVPVKAGKEVVVKYKVRVGN